jgi:hypothetical protein
MSSFREVVSQLNKIHTRITVDCIEAGRIISGFLCAVEYGQQTAQLRKLCKAAGVSPRTGHRYRKAFEQAERAGKRVIEVAKKKDLNVNRPLVREKLVELRAANPEASPERIVKLAKVELTPQRHFPELTTGQRRNNKERDRSRRAYQSLLAIGDCPIERKVELFTMIVSAAAFDIGIEKAVSVQPSQGPRWMTQGIEAEGNAA